jgi:HD-like signal output (HDOD) protein/GGDEF domain-containing protein
MESVRLTEQPQVDAGARRERIEQDPALACKILRVVNSSLFGLPSRVADLDQALSLLGIKPLKLLVLGFSLPDELFAEVAARELRWYWTGTLTKAVAARLISEQLWRKPGDEAFIAGLLSDVGTLVMLRELGRPYAKFLSGVIDERCHLSTLERKTLGFDHVQLSGMLLAQWQLPQKFVDAITAPRQAQVLSQWSAAQGELAQVLHLAELLCQLVGQRRMRVLSELLAAGKAYCQLTTAQLTELVRQLQPQVDQLAKALSLELEDERDYAQILRDAQAQMGLLSEEVVAQASGRNADEDAYARLRQQTSELTSAVRSFIDGETTTKTASTHRQNERVAVPNSAESDDRPVTTFEAPSHIGGHPALVRKLCEAATRCRQQRQELSLLLFDIRLQDALGGRSADEASRELRRALERACRTFDSENFALVSLGERRAAAVLCNCDRSAALAAANNAIREQGVRTLPARGPATAAGITFSAGVASMSVVPKNFDPARLIESAERCLNAARACGMSAVKSIEV